MTSKLLYYLGPKGTFSHQVAENYSPEYTTFPCETLTAIAHQIEQSPENFGILPIENSISSNVHQSIDLILKYKFKIQAEVYKTINFNLLATKNTSLKKIHTIYAHPVAAMQCQKLIDQLDAKVIETNSNISSQNKFYEDLSPNTAAITTDLILDHEHSSFIAENIADNERNLTRFLMVCSGNVYQKPNQANKVSLLFKAAHRPGSLASVLNLLAQENLNLTKIESRPIPGTDWEYAFWIDVKINDYSLAKLLDLLSEHTTELQILGYYDEGAIL